MFLCTFSVIYTYLVKICKVESPLTAHLYILHTWEMGIDFNGGEANICRRGGRHPPARVTIPPEADWRIKAGVIQW